jgi:hypothetical protein
MWSREHITAARASHGKAKNIAYNDIYNFGSSDEVDNEVGNEASAGSGNEDEWFKEISR